MVIHKHYNYFQVRQLSYKRLKTWYSGLVKSKPSEAPYNHIIQIGDPNLRTKAQNIPQELIKSDEIKFLVERMRKVMKKYNCVGLAATQVGIPFRLFLMEFTEKHLNDYSNQERQSKEMQVVPFKVVINPEMKITDYTKLKFIENCESVRGFHAEVPRYRGVKLSATNLNNQSFELTVIGWPARIIQHEMDHLDGKIYTDLMDRKSFTCSCWEIINERGGKVELPYGGD